MVITPYFTFGFGRNYTADDRNWSEWAYGRPIRHWMWLHKLHRETNLGLKPQYYRDGLLDTTITLYMLNRVMGDVEGGGGAIVKCWPEVAGTLGSGRQASELCLPWRINGFTSLAQFPAFSRRSVCSWSSCSTWHRRHHCTVVLYHWTLV